jgi:hypothetical protein
VSVIVVFQPIFASVRYASAHTPWIASRFRQTRGSTHDETLFSLTESKDIINKLSSSVCHGAGHGWTSPRAANVFTYQNVSSMSTIDRPVPQPIDCTEDGLRRDDGTAGCQTMLCEVRSPPVKRWLPVRIQDHRLDGHVVPVMAAKRRLTVLANWPSPQRAHPVRAGGPQSTSRQSRPDGLSHL